MSSKIMKEFKQRMNQTKAMDNNNRVVTVQINPNNVVKVITNNKIRPYEIVEQIKDLALTIGNISSKKINLSQVSDCCYDLLLTKQENVDGKMLSYFQTV
jgi:hypothetical protein